MCLSHLLCFTLPRNIIIIIKVLYIIIFYIVFFCSSVVAQCSCLVSSLNCLGLWCSCAFETIFEIWNFGFGHYNPIQVQLEAICHRSSSKQIDYLWLLTSWLVCWVILWNSDWQLNFTSISPSILPLHALWFHDVRITPITILSNHICSS